MSHLNHLSHVLHAVHHCENRGGSKLTGLAYLVAGIFLAPMLIGIPLAAYGIYKMCK